MSTLSIQSVFPLSMDLLAGALNREKKILLHSVNTTKLRVEKLSKTLAVDPIQLQAGTIVHTDANDMDLLELEGELALLGHLESELAALESSRICR